MNSYVRGAILMVLAAFVLPFEFGCENKVNESGYAPLDSVSDAPKSEAEYRQRNLDMLKSAPKVKSGAAKPARRG